jgi:hypothetical protein
MMTSDLCDVQQPEKEKLCDSRSSHQSSFPDSFALITCDLGLARKKESSWLDSAKESSKHGRLNLFVVAITVMDMAQSIFLAVSFDRVEQLFVSITNIVSYCPWRALRDDARSHQPRVWRSCWPAPHISTVRTP